MVANLLEMIKRNKTKILLYCIVILSLVSLVFISSSVLTLKFFILIPLAILTGMGFVSFLKDILPIKNIFTFLLLSLLLGLFLNTVVIFLFGSLGFAIGLPFLTIYLPITILLNLILYLILMKEDLLKSYLKNVKLDMADILWIFVLAFFLFIFLSVALEYYFLGWDGFAFWALDAKYIFNNDALRDETFDVLYGSYLSFYPLQLNYVYLLFGELVEQHASMLTLLYGIISVSLLYSYILDIKESKLMKSFLYLIVIAAFYTWFTIHNVIFTLYSDVFCSTMALLYGIVLFKNLEQLKSSSYWKRILLLVLIAASFYLTKLSYSILSVFFLAFLFFYDIKYIYEKILKKKVWILISICLIILAGVAYFYITNSSDGGGIIWYAFRKFGTDNAYRFQYIFEMLKFLISEIPLFLLSTTSFLVAAFFLKGKFKLDEVKKIVFVFLLACIPLTFYIIRLETFLDFSILRYFGLIYFVLPYLCFQIFPEGKLKSPIQEKIGVFLSVLLLTVVGFSLIVQWNVDLKLTPHSGSYKDSWDISRYYVAAERVKELVPDDARILIVSKEFESLGNSRAPAMYIKYFLSEYSVGRQYLTSVEDWYSYFFQGYTPDYVLVLEYKNYWLSCNDFLKEEAIQLIKIQPGHKDLTDTDCFFDKDDVIQVYP